MNSHVNLSSYNNVECLENFSNEEFINYCNDKLESCTKHIDFLQNMQLNDLFDICEIGSGNSKLLYALEEKNLINEAVGIEVSTSRYLFAEKFKKHVKSSRVCNINDELFNVNLNKQFDIIIGVDIVLQLISPTSKNAEELFFQWTLDHLSKDGYLILELWSFQEILQQIELSENSLKLWQEFPSSDPFKYLLAHIHKDENQNICWNKKFIKRNTYDESEFFHVLKPYSKQKIVKLLEKYGFCDIQIFDYWNQKSDCEKDEYIVVAKKKD